MKFIAILLMLIMVGCSHTSSQQDKSSLNNKKDEFYWIDNEDFEPTDEVVYRAVEDSYDISTDIPNALSKETMVTASSTELKILTEAKDPLSKSVALCYQGKFKQAFGIIDKNYAKYKQHPGYWNQVGTCYFLQKKIRKAILYYHRARIKGKNLYVPAMNNLGVLYMAQGKFQEALAAFDRAASVNNYSRTPRMNMAQLYLRFGLVYKAQRLLVQMKKQAIDDPEINALLGTIEVYKKNYGQALIYFNYLPQSMYKRADLTLNYVLALLLDGRKQHAAKLFKMIDRSKLGPLKAYYNLIQKRVL